MLLILSHLGRNNNLTIKHIVLCIGIWTNNSSWIWFTPFTSRIIFTVLVVVHWRLSIFSITICVCVWGESKWKPFRTSSSYYIVPIHTLYISLFLCLFQYHFHTYEFNWCQKHFVAWYTNLINGHKKATPIHTDYIIYRDFIWTITLGHARG